MKTNRLFRDPSAWYHMVVTVDVTQAAEADRVKWYTNGEQITIASGSTYPAQNVDLPLFSGTNMTVGGAYTTSVNVFSDWALAEFYYIDGQALDASSFGEEDSATGQWKPIEVEDMDYGVNGFYQKYNQTALAASFTDSSTGGANITSFTTVETTSWTAPTGVTSVDYLVVAGGGGGGASGGSTDTSGAGGGGAGGVKTGT